MAEAPEKIWAFGTDIFDNVSIWQDKPSPNNNTVEYIRKDVSDALVASVREEALREAARYLQKQCGCSTVTCASEYDCDMDRKRAREILALLQKDKIKRPRASVSPDHSWEDKTNG